MRVSVSVCWVVRLWLIVAAIIQNTAIRPTEITDDYIVLTGVSRDFDDAVRDERRREREREDRDYERRRSRRRDDEPRGRDDSRRDRYRPRDQ